MRWFLVFLGLLMLTGTARAEWVIMRVKAPAQVSLDGRDYRTPFTGETLPDDAYVRTGKGGRMMLRRGRERILVRPRTKMRIVRLMRRDGERTAIGHHWGKIDLDVETRPTRHVTVRTRYMTALVKGTRLSVSSSFWGSDVSVQRGQVDVMDNRGRMSPTYSGQRASASFFSRSARMSQDAVVSGFDMPEEAWAPQRTSLFSFILGRGAGTDFRGTIGIAGGQPAVASGPVAVRPSGLTVPGSVVAPPQGGPFGGNDDEEDDDDDDDDDDDQGEDDDDD